MRRSNRYPLDPYRARIEINHGDSSLIVSIDFSTRSLAARDFRKNSLEFIEILESVNVLDTYA